MARKKPAPPARSIINGEWDIERLIPYARNSRTHSPEQIDQIAASITEWGFTIPVVVDESGVIIAGHARVMAAKKLGMKKVPVREAHGWSEAQKRAYVIADNKLAMNAGWNEQMLQIEIADLRGLGFDLNLTGFSPPEIVQFETRPGGSQATTTLVDRFGIVPFSVLNAREGWWQDRKRAWIMLGIESEVGRGENLLKMSDTVLEPDPKKRAAKKAAKATKKAA
jgi:hypothetical protein